MEHGNGWSTAMWLMVLIGGAIAGSLIVLALKRFAKSRGR